MDFYGQIDLTLLGEIVRQHPEAVKKVQTRDGRAHQYLNINIAERRQPSQYGHTHYVKPGIRKADEKPSLNYYIGDLKPSQPAATTNAAPVSAASPAATPPSTIAPTPEDPDALPF